MSTITIPETKHAPGWSWRRRDPEDSTQPQREERPLGWVRYGDGPDAGEVCGLVEPRANGLCESGWHSDCPQAPLECPAGWSQCACPCHQPQGVLI